MGKAMMLATMQLYWLQYDPAAVAQILAVILAGGKARPKARMRV